MVFELGSKSSKADPTKEERLKAVRTQKLQLKREESARLASLPLGSLYVLLFLRLEQRANDYHWAFYHHTSPVGGRKYHITNLGSSGATWIAEHGTETGAFRSNFLIVAVQIGTIPENRWQELDMLTRSFDSNLNQPGMDCRVWVRRVMAVLMANGLIYFDSIDAVSAEFNCLGNQFRQSAIEAALPRPLVVSQTCH